MTPRGRLVTFEGIEGSGKTTQLVRLADRLRAEGAEVVVTREPGGTPLGKRLRSLLLDPHAPRLDPPAELLLYAADRAQHLEEVVLPALAEGSLVLCDRFLDATLAYQGHARGLGPERILALHRAPPLDLRPDRTFLFDLDPEIALSRARARRDAEDRFEREDLAFHRAVREGYLALARDEPGRIRVVDAAGDRDAVTAALRRAWETA